MSAPSEPVEFFEAVPFKTVELSEPVSLVATVVSSTAFF
ncbi:hypothetical protein EUBVEN_00986 [Eubacterium ventriosum ATCC 27560]|uniref:Uncharacterized protein n=1 Tax=Eubacterium ventriosum ATCC 27560 TaxID=411463 RepID=A5Z5K6_9FIRM|nr:hypothetical protein EUBVEN_00986 [Eubacterium ventriosum ATCC 27560]